MQKNNNNNGQVNLLDLFFYLLGHWYWFALCVAVCVGFAYYKYSKMSFIYRSDATVIIKDPSNTRSTVHLDNYSGLINKVIMSNEILQLQSRQLMMDVVTSLDADINYLEKDKLRNLELYKRAPVRMSLDRSEGRPEYLSLKVRIGSGGDILVNEKVHIKLGDTLEVSGMPVSFQPTAYYNDYLGKEITITKVPVRSAASGFLSRMKIQQTESDASILSLSMQDYSVFRANDVLEKLVEKYNEASIREKNRIAVNTAAFINERLLIIQNELSAVEDNIAEFKISERIMSVDAAANEYLAQSKKYGDQIVEIEAREKLADYLEEYLSASFKTYETIPVNTGLEDENLSRAIDEYNKLIMQRERLIEESSEGSPAVKRIESQLPSLRSNILGFIGTYKTSLEVSKHDLATREEDALRNFTSMPAKARHLLSIERQQKIKETLYIFLLNKREENALTQAMVDNNARMIDTAEGSWTPIYPDRNKTLLVAFLIGIFIPALILIALLLLDTKIRSRKDLDSSSELPFLAEIPKLMGQKRKKKKKGVLNAEAATAEYNGQHSKVFKEALRMMSTNIDFTKPEGCKTPVIMTTSFNVGVGKTFVVRNVAACLADAQKKVIIIDADLRKRSFSDWFGLRHNTMGLSNYLIDSELKSYDVIKTSVLPGVDLIPAGHIPPNPMEILSRARFDDLIAELRERYDYILLDGTPVNMVADSFVLGRVVDMTLFIIRADVSDRRQLPLIEELIQENRLKNLTIVLNGTDARHVYGYNYGYGYGYGYNYGYGYGYSYGDDTKEEK